MRSNKLPPNPYEPGQPVYDAKFFDRRDTLDWLKQQIQSRSLLVLSGPRRIGKTSLLHRIERELAEMCVAVFFDLQHLAFEDLSVVLRALVKAIGDRTGQATPDKAAFAADPHGTFRAFLAEAFQTAAFADDKQLVLLFDEFEALAQEADNNSAARALLPFLGELGSLGGRLARVVALGREPGYLSQAMQSDLKAAVTREIGVMDLEDARQIVIQAEVNGTLRFTPEAIDHILQLTYGFPYLIQLLCDAIWSEAYRRQASATPPVVDVANVDMALPIALKQGASGLGWYWDGLSLEQKIYWSAIAQLSRHSNDWVLDEEVQQAAQNEAERLLARDLSRVADELVEKGYLKRHPQESSYAFQIEMLRRWVRETKTLHQVKEELDRADVNAAQSYDRAAKAMDERQVLQAIDELHAALRQSPNHFPSLHLLGRVLLDPGEFEGHQNIDEAIKYLEKAYTLDSRAVRRDLSRALLVRAKRWQTEDDPIHSDPLLPLERVLEIDPDHVEARQAAEKLWHKRAEEAERDDRLEDAQHYFRKANALAEVERLERELQIKRSLEEAARQAEQSNYRLVESSYRQLIEEYPDDNRIQYWREQSEGYKQQADYLEARIKQLQTEVKALRDWDSALASATGLVNKYPNHPEREAWERIIEEATAEKEAGASFARAESKIKAMRFDEALFELETLQKKQPHFQRGVVSVAALTSLAKHRQRVWREFEQKGRWPAASAEYTALRRSAASDWEKEQWRERADYCERQNKASIQFRLGKDYLKSEQWAEAIAAFQASIALEPTYEENGLSAARGIDLARHRAKPPSRWAKVSVRAVALLAAVMLLGLALLFAIKQIEPLRTFVVGSPPTAIPVAAEHSSPDPARGDQASVAQPSATVAAESTPEPTLGPTPTSSPTPTPHPLAGKQFELQAAGEEFVIVRVLDGVNLYRQEGGKLTLSDTKEVVDGLPGLSVYEKPEPGEFDLVTLRQDGVAELWPIQDGRFVPLSSAANQVDLGDGAEWFAFAPGGFVLLATTAEGVRMLCVGDGGAMTVGDDLGALKNITAAVFTANGSVEEKGDLSAELITASGEGELGRYKLVADKKTPGCSGLTGNGDRLDLPSPVGEEPVTASHGGLVSKMALSPDGRLLATGGVDGRVLLWRLVNDDNGHTIASLADGQSVMSGLEGSSIMGLSFAAVAEQPPSGNAAPPSQDHLLLIAGTTNGKVKVIELADDGSVLGTNLDVSSSQASLVDLIAGPNGIILLAAGWQVPFFQPYLPFNQAQDESVTRLAMARGQRVTVDAAGRLAIGSISPDDSLTVRVLDTCSEQGIVAAGLDGDDGAFRVWQVMGTDEMPEVRPAPPDIGVAIVQIALDCGPDAVYLFAAGNDGSLRLWQSAVGGEFSPFGDTLCLGFNYKNGNNSFGPASSIDLRDFGENGFIAVGTSEGAVRSCAEEYITDRYEQTYGIDPGLGLAGSIASVIFQPNDPFALAFANNGSLYWWEGYQAEDDVEPVLLSLATRGQVQQIVFSPGGAWLAAAVDTGRVFLVDATTRAVYSCFIHVGNVNSLVFEDETTFISAGEDWEVRMWTIQRSDDGVELVGEGPDADSISCAAEASMTPLAGVPTG